MCFVCILFTQLCYVLAFLSAGTFVETVLCLLLAVSVLEINDVDNDVMPI